MRNGLKENWNKGFSLVEMLAVVAIIVILLGVSGVGVIYYRNWLKLTELDNAARSIYMAAENRAVLLSGERRLGGLVKGGGEVTLTRLSGGDGGTAAYVVTRDDGNLSQLLPVGTIDPALLEGDFYIVYEPVSGSVTDVFYAEQPIERLEEADYSAFYSKWSSAGRTARMRAEPMLGYYGGGTAEGEAGETLPTPQLTVLIRNEERLTVEVSYWLPGELQADGGTLRVTAGGAELTDQPGRQLESTSRPEGDGTRYTTVWVLDELAGQTGGPPLRFQDLNTGLVPGADLTVQASLSYSPDRAPLTASDRDNSLFAEGSGGATALIKNLRHLQNLSAAFSGVKGKTGAEQASDILCRTNETYPDYEFQPIQNDALRTYNGGGRELQELYIPRSDGPAGLFAGLSGTPDAPWSLTEVRLVNAQVAGGTDPAGALAGELGGCGSITGCRVWWEDEGQPNLRGRLGSDEAGYQFMVTGRQTGGLIGSIREGAVTIQSSFAATTLSGTECTGGLIGAMSGRVEITGSYAGCYLTGPAAAGLIGSADLVTLTDCYASGFIVGDQVQKAGGLCLGDGKVEASRVYSAMRFPGGAAVCALTEGQSAANHDTFKDTYYLGAGTVGAGGAGLSYGEMTDREGNSLADRLGTSFAWKDARGSSPYNLQEHLNLTVYSFPGLQDLPHWGDWGAEFKEPSLVYYELHDDGTYRFSGGNARYLVNNLEAGSIRSDGYAVAFLQTDVSAGGGTVSTVTALCRDVGGNEVWRSTQEVSKLIPTTGKDGQGNEASYYLMLMSGDVVNSPDAPEDLYQYLSLELRFDNSPGASGEYFYNPHFAETVIPYAREEGEAAPTEAWALEYARELLKNGRSVVSVRTPRHLYDLGEHREYFHSVSHRLTFSQGLDLNYAAYTGYGLFPQGEGGGYVQKPIGSGDSDGLTLEQRSFNGSYNGNCHTIRGVVFGSARVGQSFYAGLFGSSTGSLRNIVCELNPDSEFTVAMGDGSMPFYAGALAGANNGTVDNCAVSGVRMKARGFTGATMYIGGLVGWNSGTIRNCGAETASLSADNSTYAGSYSGGLVGRNDAIITNSYAVGRVTAEVEGTSTARICGFVGYNTGSVFQCYAAVDLKSSGEGIETYGFCGVRSGSQSGTFYLNDGNFTYRDESYAASYTPRRATPITYEGLTANPMAGMSLNGQTDPGLDGPYPYPTGVKDAKGNPVHYGQWPAPMALGEMGVYYWERLETGGEVSYHISALAVDPGAETPTVSKLTTLSAAHDDGGVVTRYGYGYYSKTEVSKNVTFRSEKIGYTGYVYYSQRPGGSYLKLSAMTGSEATNADADKALADLMPGYTFHSWESYREQARAADGVTEDERAARTVSGLCLFKESANTSIDPNGGAFILTQRTAGKTVTAEFTVNPQFADSMSVKSKGLTLKNGASAQPVGSAANPFQVRCGMQLQEINWYDTAYTDVAVGFETYYAPKYFPYLSGRDKSAQYYWKQTHDLDWTGEGNTYVKDGVTYPGVFFPIAQTTINGKEIPGWFGGNYDGGSYVMKNFNIAINTGTYEVNCMGLFGVVKNARLSNIVMFSETGTDVVTVKGRKAGTADSDRWYAGGVLVGLAQNSAITNCAVAGYTIRDEAVLSVTTKSGSIGGAIGGLVGMTDMDLTGCTASAAIQIEIGYKDEKKTTYIPVRAGGLVGSTTGAVTDCYTGGSISVGSKAGSGVRAGGITGGVGMAPLTGANSTGASAIRRCYTCVSLPEDTKLIDASPIGNPAGTETGGNSQTVASCFYLSDRSGTDGGVTYQQLSGREPVTLGTAVYPSIYDVLTGFRPVTSEVDGFSVSGKYSYPPSTRGDLKGMNYPFPTVLEREGYHVHYGQWPLQGIRRDRGGEPIVLDLFVNLTPYTEQLELVAGTPTGGVWTVKPVEEEPGAPKPAALVAVTAGNNAATLTVTPQTEGTVTRTVQYTVGGTVYELELIINVTARLKLTPASVTIFSGETFTLPLSVCGLDGQELADQTGLTLTEAGSSGEVAVRIVQSVYAPAADGGAEKRPTIELVGAEPGTHTVNVSFTYPYPNAQEGAEPSRQSTAITVVVEPLPEAERSPDGRTYTLTFGTGFEEIEIVSLTSGGAPVTGYTPVADPGKGRLTLTHDSWPQDLELTVKLTLSGREHTITIALPPEKPAAG